MFTPVPEKSTSFLSYLVGPAMFMVSSGGKSTQTLK